MKKEFRQWQESLLKAKKDYLKEHPEESRSIKMIIEGLKEILKEKDG